MFIPTATATAGMGMGIQVVEGRDLCPYVYRACGVA
jgi:hypothetical protein